MSKRTTNKQFENNEHIGAYADIQFCIISDTELGKESIRFETKIHYVDKGKGKPILLVHGIGQSLYTWRKNIDFFVSNGYRVLAIDLAGCGHSGHPHIYYTVEEYGLILKAFLDALHIKKADIVAFSTGCLSTICLAALHPKRVGKLILISPGGPNENYPFSLKFLTTWLGQTMFHQFVSETSVYNILKGMFFDSTLVTNDIVQGYFDPYRNKDVRDALSMCMRHFDDTYTCSLLKGIRHKTLIFSGMDDKVHTNDIIRTYAITIPNAKHIRIRNCSHFVHEEKPLKFNSKTMEFLQKSDYIESGFESMAYTGG